MWKRDRYIDWVWRWLEKFTKPSTCFLMKCSVKELYSRYNQIVLGTQCSREWVGEFSINMMEREKALYLQWRRERWRNVFWRGKTIWERRFMESCGMKWRNRCEIYKWYGLHSPQCTWIVSDRALPSQEPQQHCKQLYFGTAQGSFLAQLVNDTAFRGDPADICAGYINLCW